MTCIYSNTLSDVQVEKKGGIRFRRRYILVAPVIYSDKRMDEDFKGYSFRLIDGHVHYKLKSNVAKTKMYFWSAKYRKGFRMITHTNLRVTEKIFSHNQGINQDFVKNGQSKQYYS